jgi:hypothetical protein
VCKCLFFLLLILSRAPQLLLYISWLWFLSFLAYAKQQTSIVHFRAKMLCEHMALIKARFQKAFQMLTTFFKQKKFHNFTKYKIKIH